MEKKTGNPLFSAALFAPMTCPKIVEYRSALWTVTPLTCWECWDCLFPSALFVTQLVVMRCESWWHLTEEGHETVLRQDTENPGGYIFAYSGWKCVKGLSWPYNMPWRHRGGVEVQLFSFFNLSRWGWVVVMTCMLYCWELPGSHCIWG